MSDYTPTVTKADIDRIIRRDYSQNEPATVWGILLLYGSGESYRVYAAALKQGGGNPERLREMIDLANLDYRDLLAAAEYPAQMKAGLFGYHSPETIKADEVQYYDWFNK
jgi:hypothetical protein